MRNTVPYKQGHVNACLVTVWSDRCARIIGHWGVSLKAKASQNVWDNVEKKVKKTTSKVKLLLAHQPNSQLWLACFPWLTLHSPTSEYINELGTKKLFMLPSEQTLASAVGLSLLSLE